MIGVALALLAGACSQQNAEIGSDPVEIKGFNDRTDDDSAAAGSDDAALTEPTTEPIVAPPTGIPEPTVEVPSSAEASDDTAPQVLDDSTDVDDPRTPDPAYSTPGRGNELGCQNASSMRQLLATTEIADAVSVLPAEVWLCPDTIEVVSEFECFPLETELVLVALEADTVYNGAAAASELRNQSAIFCNAANVISLGEQAILETIEELQGD